MNKNYEIVSIPGLVRAPIYKLYKDDKLVREIYLVVHKKTGIVAMWDKVKNRIYKDSNGREYTLIEYLKLILDKNPFSFYMKINPATGKWEYCSREEYILDRAKNTSEYYQKPQEQFQLIQDYNFFKTTYLDNKYQKIEYRNI